jgi:hypothetical protein
MLYNPFVTPSLDRHLVNIMSLVPLLCSMLFKYTDCLIVGISLLQGAIAFYIYVET